MTTRERFHAVLNGQPLDRLPIVEWAVWWNETIDRWHHEGLPKNVQDRYDINRFFGQDVWFQMWTHAVHWDCPWHETHHGSGRMADCPSFDDIAPFIGRWPVACEEYRKGFSWQTTGEAAVWFTFPGFFWGPRDILGIERHLYAFYEEPDLLHRINGLLSDWMLRYIEELDELGTPDFMTFAEDLSYNHGPMLSQASYNEFLDPYYRRVIPALHDRGIRVFIDTDGDVTSCAGWFLASGIEGILPLERQAGVDVARLRESHPELLLIGAFDKMTMTRGEEAMREEFERLLPTMRQPGFIPSVDHQTPPGVSFDDYLVYMKLLTEYTKKAAS